MPLMMSVLHLVGQLAAGDVGLDQARRHAIDADAVRSELARHGLGKAEHAGLGRRIMRAAENAAAALRGDGGHAADGALFPLAHMRDEGLAEMQDAGKIDAEHRIPGLVVDLHDLQRLRDAGIVDQDVDLAEGGDRLLCRLTASLAIGDVAGNANMAGAQFSRRSVSTRRRRDPEWRPSRHGRRTALPSPSRCRADLPRRKSRRSCRQAT